MKLLDGFGFTTNLISIITIIISVYIFFTDLFRRWLFFGYKPTAIVIVMDSVKNDVLIIKRNFAHNVKRDFPWHFPQGGIYYSDINGTVNGVLNREFKLDSREYDFEKTVVLGKKKIKERKIYTKYSFGSFSLFRTLKGKGYVVCIVYANLKNIKKKIKLGFELDAVKIVDFNSALTMIDPKKAHMLKTASKQILYRDN